MQVQQEHLLVEGAEPGQEPYSYIDDDLYINNADIDSPTNMDCGLEGATSLQEEPLPPMIPKQMCWIQWLCSLEGHEFLLEIEPEYILD